MPIIFGAISPHPPIIIPEIGGKETKRVQKTIKALKKMAQNLEKAEPDTIIVISPHGLIYPDRMNICGMPKLEGNFDNFGHPEVEFKFENDLELAQKIAQNAEKEGLETLLYSNNEKTFSLDHGTLVPLYFLTQYLTGIKILPIAYSYQSREIHFSFGQVLAELAKKTKKRVAIIASGDLSHRLTTSAPAGYSEAGKKFDQALIQALEKNDTEEILHFDEEFLEEAGECGYRSILILLGALEKLQTKPQKLSYEGPFGVGYLVFEYQIEE